MIPPTKTPPRCDKPEASGQGAARSGNDGGIKPPLLEFKAAFDKLLDTVKKVTPNIVVIGPPPFQHLPAPLPDLGAQNLELDNYSAVMQAAAQAHGSPIANVHPDGDPWDAEWPFTVDGISLNKIGCFLTASKVANDLLSWRDTSRAPGSLIDRLQGKQELALREAIQKRLQTKNRLWHDYWRPSNWAFLHGDRTNQPSSRDPVNPQVRLFPVEQEKYLPLIKEAEEKIFQLVQEAQKKVP